MNLLNLLAYDTTNMKPISIERGWEVYNEMVGDRKFVSELHEEQVRINYWRPKGYDYKDGEVTLRKV